MSLSEVLNSEGEEAAREAAKAQELQEMVASLSATANRTLDYEIPASDSSSNSKDFLHNDVILAASTSDSNGSDILPELPAHFSALTETQPKLLKDSRNRVEQTEQPEIEAKSVKDLEKEPEQLKESLDKSHEGKTGEQKDTTMPAVSKEIYEESKIVQEEGQDLKNENKKEEKTDEKHESVQHPQVVEETKEPKEEPESKREQEKVQDLKPELDKHQGSQEKVQEYVKQTTEEQKNEENQIKITELEQLNVQELQGGQVQIPELKLDESKDLDAEEETQTVHENSRGPKEGPEEIQKPKEDEEIIQMPTKNQEEINKPDEEREKLMKPEEYLEELNEGQPDTKEQIKEHNTVSGPEKTETSRELSIEQQAPEPEKKKEHVELPENDEPQYEDGSILPDKKLPSLTLNEENYTPEAPTLESPSDNSEPKSNGSNDESKQTEESKLSDKEEITELGVSDDNSIKEKDDGNSASDGKGSESSSIKEDLKSIEINEEYNAVNEKIKSAANADSLNLAATTIQSGFRGFKARKQLKEDTKVEEEGTKSTDKESIPDKQTNKDVGENDTEESKNQESSVEHQNDELGVNLTDGKNQTDDSKSITVPEPLMKIAQAEVDRICQEAEKATESLMTPPPMIEDSDVRETDQEDSEDFPAPPDDLMDSIGKNEITKDHDSSGTQSTEPTVPLGSNTDGDSSKTEDTTAPSLAESEIKSTEPTPSHNNDDNKLESSFTENVNTEVAVNRDSTEGELTMEEDSKEEELSSVLHSSKEHELDENKEEKKAGLPDGSKDKAAVIIQAGYRGFKTRKELKNVTDNGEASPEEEEKDEISNQQEISSEKKDIVSPQVSNKDSDSEIKDENSSTSKSEEELNESAKKIQAGIRGYLVRKDQKVKRDAAVKIQSHFRGFKTRQRLKEESS